MKTTFGHARILLVLLLCVRGISTFAFAQTGADSHKKTNNPNTANATASFSVKVSGHGAPMILIPGMASSGETWNGTVAHYQDHYTCYVLTLAGFAGEPAIQAPLLPTVVDDLAAYIEKYQLKKPVIIGHSLGGNIAMDLAVSHPDLVGPVVIVDSLPFYANLWFEVRTLDEAKPMIAAMKKRFDNQTRDQYEQSIRSGAFTKYMVSSPSDLQTLIQWGLASDPKTVSGAEVELVSEDLRPQLANIKSPTLVLGTWSGLHDQFEQSGITITKAAVTQTFQQQFAGLPRMHFALAEKARHFIMWDDPKWFIEQLDTFLANPVRVTQDRGFDISPSAVAAGPAHL